MQWCSTTEIPVFEFKLMNVGDQIFYDLEVKDGVNCFIGWKKLVTD